MSQMPNLDAFFDAQYKAVRKLFEDGDAYEVPCLRLLEEPALPHSLRVTCCFMMSKDPSNADFYVKEATRVLDKLDTMIEKGQVGTGFQSWVDRARNNFEKVKKHHLENPVTGEGDSTAIVEQEQEAQVQQGTEEITTAIPQMSDDEESAPSTIVPRSQYASTISEIPHHAVSTEHTSIPAEPADAASAKREDSPPTHPAVQQMEDDADMLFGDHTDFENWTADEQAAWRAAAPDRVRKRMRGEDEADAIEGEHPAKKQAME